MLIDWFTVGAQALNFLILVWLMKRFLYRPVLDALDAREKKIAAQLADADAKKAEAQKEQDAFRKRNEDFDQERAGLYGKAAEEAKTEGQRLLEEGRKTSDAAAAQSQARLFQDASDLRQKIGDYARQEVFAIARKTLADLSSSTLEASTTAVFTQHLRALDGSVKAGFADALASAADPALVRSAFDLPEPQRANIQNALNETFSADIPIRYETNPELISGIELSLNGQKLSWSIADYLASLEQGVSDLVRTKDQPEAAIA